MNLSIKKMILFLCKQKIAKTKQRKNVKDSSERRKNTKQNGKSKMKTEYKKTV